MSITLENVLEEMKEIENTRKDLNLPLDSLLMQDDGKIKSFTYGEFDPSLATINKLCNMYKLSNSHLQVLIDEDRHDLVAEQFNHFLTKDHRMMKLRTVDNNRIKGIVSKDYKKFDDYHLFTQINDYFKDNDLDYELDILNIDDEYTRFRFMLPKTELNMGMAVENGIDNDIVQGGFEITNSEIGMRGMSVNSLVYRQVCTNGMMGLISDDNNNEIFQNRDKNFNPFSRRAAINTGLNNAVEKSNNNITLFKKTKDIIVDDPKREIKEIGSKYNLGKNHVDSIIDCFEEENQKNYFGILNGITRYGRRFQKDYKNRSKFEFIANDILSKVAS